MLEENIGSLFYYEMMIYHPEYGISLAVHKLNRVSVASLYDLLKIYNPPSISFHHRNLIIDRIYLSIYLLNSLGNKQIRQMNNI